MSTWVFVGTPLASPPLLSWHQRRAACCCRTGSTALSCPTRASSIQPLRRCCRVPLLARRPKHCRAGSWPSSSLRPLPCPVPSQASPPSRLRGRRPGRGRRQAQSRRQPRTYRSRPRWRSPSTPLTARPLPVRQPPPWQCRSCSLPARGCYRRMAPSPFQLSACPRGR